MFTFREDLVSSSTDIGGDQTAGRMVALLSLNSLSSSFTNGSGGRF